MAKTIIIAVHDPHILYLLQRYAEESGFATARICQSKELPSVFAQAIQPALIILDTGLPAATGRKLSQGLRIEAAARHIPIVLYSGQDDLAEEKCEGAIGYLPKSVMYDDFTAALARAGI
jgi:DNA-binding response OmpR family regulator